MPKVVTRGMDHCTPGAIEKRERIYAHSAYDDAEKSPFEMYARGPGQRTITAHPASAVTRPGLPLPPPISRCPCSPSPARSLMA